MLDTKREMAIQILHRNWDEVIAGEKPLSDLGVEATDDSTFVVHLSQPCGFLLGLMAFPSFFPLNQEFYESKGNQFGIGTTEDLIYCGPYTMTDWQAGNQYTFTRNADYWNADAVETETVTFKFLQDTQSAMLEYQQGNIDVVKLNRLMPIRMKMALQHVWKVMAGDLMSTSSLKRCRTSICVRLFPTQSIVHPSLKMY